MHFGRDAAVGAGAVGIAEHEHKKHHRRRGVVETRSTKPTLMTRIRGPNAKSQTMKTTTTIEPDSNAAGRSGLGGSGLAGGTAASTRRNGRWGGRRGARTGGGIGMGSGTGAGVGATGGRRQRRSGPSLGDKVSGAMLKLKGTLMNRPGEKAAGDRRMHGTRRAVF